MNIKEFLQAASHSLFQAVIQIESGEYHVAKLSLDAAFANIREAMQLVDELDRQFQKSEKPIAKR